MASCRPVIRNRATEPFRSDAGRLRDIWSMIAPTIAGRARGARRRARIWKRCVSFVSICDRSGMAQCAAIDAPSGRTRLGSAIRGARAMSWHSADDPIPGDHYSCDAIQALIVPRSRDLGSFAVRRALPSAQRQMVGPFIFFDQMGPSEFLLGQGMDVRPHPHIGLSTVTYLFDGEITHRDSLGTELPIRPGELNWMTAGRGITHSERTSSDLRQVGSKLFGIQSWVALTAKDEEAEPAFEHYDAPALPLLTGEGKTVR